MSPPPNLHQANPNSKIFSHRLIHSPGREESRNLRSACEAGIACCGCWSCCCARRCWSCWPEAQFGTSQRLSPLAIEADLGMGQNEATRNWTTGFSHCFHLPGCHFGYLFLTHSHLGRSFLLGAWIILEAYLPNCPPYLSTHFPAPFWHFVKWFERKGASDLVEQGLTAYHPIILAYKAF